jgi:hypothetical protein
MVYAETSIFNGIIHASFLSQESSIQKRRRGGQSSNMVLDELEDEDDHDLFLS